LIGASVIALCATPFAAPAMAQTTTPAPSAAAPTTPVTGEVVVVTARRKALQTATERKKNADTIIDSIVADEAGKLPDTSITEVLQRVAGVTITRFASLSSPDQFSFEGTGVQVRGLSGITGLLNGEEVDSANGGGGLSWGDVTPELMAAVDVYKQSTADLVEGGLGGAIDLRTRMPFDYKKPEVDINASVAYSDFAKGTAPQASIMATDRWETPIGDFGALVDLAYARYFYADSFARTEPYYQEGTNVTSGSTVYVPGGFDYGNDEFDRTRRGLYAAFQWRPNSDLTLYQTDFVSNYHQTNGGGGVFVAQDCCATPGSNDVFDSKGVFQGGTISYGTAAAPGASPGNSNNYNPSDNTEADFNQGFVWTPTQKLRIQGAAEVVESGSYAGDYGMGVVSNNVYEESITGLHGNLPDFSLPGITAGTTGPDTPIATPTGAIGDIIWNTQKNKAQQIALNLDADYDLGDGFFKSVKAGVRYQTRDEKDDFTGTWWSATDRGWNGNGAPQQTIAMNPKDTSLYTFPNFFKGQLTAPSPYYFFTQTSPQEFMHDVDLYTANLGSAPTNCGPQTFPAVPANSPYTVNFGNCPNDVHTSSQTFDTYLLAKFGHDQIGWLPAFSGNIGVRMVHDYVESSGAYTVTGGANSPYFYLTQAAANAAYQAAGGAAAIFASYQKGQPASADLLNYEADQLTGSSVIRKETKHYTLALPDVNVAFRPNSQWVIRFAIDQTVSPPGFNDIRANGTTSVGTTLKNPNQPAFLAYQESQGISAANAQNLPGILESLNYTAGNTGLNPAVSTNEDISVEWYPSSSTNAHVDVFNKSIRNEIIYNNNTYYEDIPSSAGNLGLPYSSTSDYNAQKTATLTGAEFGARTYFDQLPGALKGLGIEANYTIINSHSPGDYATDMTGNVITGLPIVGLSNTSYNINLLYDFGKWDARLAYNWRSKYLATTTGNGTTGTYTPPDPQPGDVISTSGLISYSLPVYVAAASYLDAHLSYKVNDHVSVAFDGSNLLNTVSKTMEEILPGDFQVRSWFMNDVRYSFSVSAKF
jgi:TonB-dependent receptor